MSYAIIETIECDAVVINGEIWIIIREKDEITHIKLSAIKEMLKK